MEFILSTKQTCWLVWVLVRVIHDDHQSQPSLLSRGDDLLGRQEEAVRTLVPQLKSVGVLDTLLIRPVDGVTTSLV